MLSGDRGLTSGRVGLQEDCTVDELVDVIEGSRIYIPCIYAVNKVDQITLEELNVLDKLPHYCPVCAYLEWNLDGLIEMCWDYLGLLRIYTKPKGKLPDYNDPVVLPKDRNTVEDFCNRIHKVDRARHQAPCATPLRLRNLWRPYTHLHIPVSVPFDWVCASETL